ncbi:MAG: FeoB-associated Cys-rich membrane protein [Capnocytophaga sp.]
MQTLISYVLVVVAVAFLVKKLFFGKKKGGCSGGTGCNCHH